jgi:hypothetical protein
VAGGSESSLAVRWPGSGRSCLCGSVRSVSCSGDLPGSEPCALSDRPRGGSAALMTCCFSLLAGLLADDDGLLGNTFFHAMPPLLTARPSHGATRWAQDCLWPCAEYLSSWAKGLQKHFDSGDQGRRGIACLAHSCPVGDTRSVTSSGHSLRVADSSEESTRVDCGVRRWRPTLHNKSVVVLVTEAMG